MNKFFKYMFLVALVCSPVIVRAQSDLLTNTSYDYTKKYQSESVGLPESDSFKKVGWVIRTIDISGGRDTAPVGTTTLTDVTMPTNAVVMQVIIDVIEATLPLTNTVSIGFNGAADMLAATTNLNSTGIKAGIPVDTAATAVKMTNNRNLQYTVANGAITQGIFEVWSKYYRSQ